MVLDTEHYEEYYASLERLLEIMRSSSYSSGIAAMFQQHLKDPDFKDNFWVNLNQHYRKLLDVGLKYSQLSNENPNDQLEARRLVAIIRMVPHRTFLKSFRDNYILEHGDDISKRKLRSFINEYVHRIPDNLHYEEVEGESNDYDIRFKLISSDGKTVLVLNPVIDSRNRIRVYGSAEYKDNSFYFEVDQFQFDPLLYPNLEACVNELLQKIKIRESMCIVGTRVRIASYVSVLTKKDLSIAQSEILRGGSATLYTLTGERITISNEPNGKLLDRMNTALFAMGNEARLFFTVVNIKEELALMQKMKLEKEEAEETARQIAESEKAANEEFKKGLTDEAVAETKSKGNVKAKAEQKHTPLTPPNSNQKSKPKPKPTKKK